MDPSAMPSMTGKSYAQPSTVMTVSAGPSKRKASTMDDDDDDDYDSSEEAPAHVGKKPRKSAAGRKLIRWSFDKDQELVMALEYVANKQGITLPFDEAVQLMQPGATGQAAVQHLAKVRKLRKKKNMWVPPELIKRRGRKHTQAQENDGDDDGDDQPYEGSTNRMIYIPLKAGKKGSGQKVSTGAIRSAVSKQQTGNTKRNPGSRRAPKVEEEFEDDMVIDDPDAADPEQDYLPEGMAAAASEPAKKKRGRPFKTPIKKEAPAPTSVSRRRTTQNVDYTEPEHDEETNQVGEFNRDEDEDDSEYDYFGAASKAEGKQMTKPIRAPKKVMQSVEAEKSLTGSATPVAQPSPINNFGMATQLNAAPRYSNNFSLKGFNQNMPVAGTTFHANPGYGIPHAAPDSNRNYSGTQGNASMSNFGNASMGKSGNASFMGNNGGMVSPNMNPSSFGMNSGNAMYPSPRHSYAGTPTQASYMPMADIPERNYSKAEVMAFMQSGNNNMEFATNSMPLGNDNMQFDGSNIQNGGNMQYNMQNANLNQNYPSSQTTPRHLNTQQIQTQSNRQGQSQPSTPAQQYQSYGMTHHANHSGLPATGGSFYSMQPQTPHGTAGFIEDTANNSRDTQFQGANNTINPADLTKKTEDSASDLPSNSFDAELYSEFINDNPDGPYYGV